MSNKWYRRMAAVSAAVAAGAVVFAAPALAEEPSVSVDPCNPNSIIVTVPEGQTLTSEELDQLLANFQNQNSSNNSQNGATNTGGDGDGTIPVVTPKPDDNVEHVQVIVVIKPKPKPDPGEIVIRPTAQVSTFTAASCEPGSPEVTPSDPSDTGTDTDTDTDTDAVLGSLESVSFGSLGQLLGL